MRLVSSIPNAISLVNGFDTSSKNHIAGDATAPIVSFVCSNVLRGYAIYCIRFQTMTAPAKVDSTVECRRRAFLHTTIDVTPNPIHFDSKFLNSHKIVQF